MTRDTVCTHSIGMQFATLAARLAESRGHSVNGRDRRARTEHLLTVRELPICAAQGIPTGVKGKSVKVEQLRRFLRQLPADMAVLQEDAVSVFAARAEDFMQIELHGKRGPTALLISSHRVPPFGHRPFQPAEKMRPMQRVRAREVWVEAERRRHAREALLEKARGGRSNVREDG